MIPEIEGKNDAYGFIRLLLVDPDSEVRASLRKGLESRFEIIEASNAEEAIERLSERFISAVLTDNNLPDRDGVSLLEQISAMRPHVRRVLMSSRAVPNVLGLRDGGVIHLFMAKPVEPDNFAIYFETTP